MSGSESQRRLRIVREGEGDTGDGLVGRTIAGRYEVLRKIGEGAMGAVYRARRVGAERPLALKVLWPELTSREEDVQRFLEEAQIASRIADENVIDIFYSGKTGGLVFLAMEYLEGRDLGAVIAAEGAMPWPRARGIVLQITKALAAAHALGIVHRDVKPQNVFLLDRPGARDFVKVLDFGIAKIRREPMNRATRLIGSPEYMAPEPTFRQPMDARADIYSFGCVMYYLLTGSPPFESPRLQALLAKHAFEPVVPPSERRPDLGIPRPVEEILLRAMAKRREHRWQSMQELHDALASVRPRPSIAARTLQPATQERRRLITFEGSTADLPPPRRKRFLFAAALVSGVSVLGLAGGLLFGHVPGKLRVTASPGDVTVRLDGVEVGRGSPVVVRARAGDHQLSVAREGFVSEVRPVLIRPLRTGEVSVTLRPAP